MVGKMSHDDEVCLKLGREVIRMIRGLRKDTSGEYGYARRMFTFPGGSVEMIIASHREIADLMDKAAAKAFEIAEKTPSGEVQ